MTKDIMVIIAFEDIAFNGLCRLKERIFIVVYTSP